MSWLTRRGAAGSWTVCPHRHAPRHHRLAVCQIRNNLQDIARREATAASREAGSAALRSAARFGQHRSRKAAYSSELPAQTQ
jgi:hypothetical protein